MGMMSVLYMWHQFIKSRPLTEFPRILILHMVEWVWFTMTLTCFSHLRLLVMKTPRYHREVTVMMLC